MDYSEALPSQGDDDRRNEQRTALLYRPARVEAGGFSGIGLVRNVSTDGLMVKVFTDLAPGTPIRVDCGPTLLMTGKVAWSKDGQVGVAFDAAIDVGEVLAKIGSKVIEGRVNRPPRLPVHFQAELKGERAKGKVEIEDISQHGARARTDLLRVGDEVLITVDGLEPRKAIARWAGGGMVGLNFTRPYKLEELAAWALKHQGGGATAAA